jgi:hypothetical protein
MFRLMKLMLAVAAILGLTAGAALAQGYRDAGAKAAGSFGTGFHTGGMRAVETYRSLPVSPAPQVVQTMPAPMAEPPAPQVAPVPTDRRSFSADPSRAQAAPMAPAAPQVIRSYSYEPTARVYRAPMRSRESAPSFLLPRTDARKHGG